MNRVQSRQERQIPSEDRPHIEPICVRISAAVKLTGIGRLTLYELIKVGRSTFIRYVSLKSLFEKC